MEKSEFLKDKDGYQFSANETVDFLDDGTALFNQYGLNLFLFDNKDDAYTFLCRGESVECLRSDYIGSRDINPHLDEECLLKGIKILEEEDGSSVYTDWARERV